MKLALIPLVLLTTSLAHGQLINGSFETATIDPDSGSIPLIYPSLAVDGWYALQNHPVEYVGTMWEASDGDRSINLGNLGGIGSYLLSLDPNQVYKCTFDMAADPRGGDRTVSLDWSFGSGGVRFTFDSVGRTVSDMGWEKKSFMFSGNMIDTLYFIGRDESPYGAVIDNVTLQAVPEPAGFAAVSLGLVALIRRRRTR